VVRSVKENAPYWAEKLPELPNLLYENLNSQQHIQRQLERQHQQQLMHQQQASRSSFWSLLAASGVVSTAWLVTESSTPLWPITFGVITVILGSLAWRSRPRANNL